MVLLLKCWMKILKTNIAKKKQIGNSLIFHSLKFNLLTSQWNILLTN